MKRLIVLLILAATVAPATAQVRTWERDRDRRDYYGENYERHGRERYNSQNRNRWTRDFRGRWVSLGQSYSAGTERQFINLYGQRGTFRHLRIEGERGGPVIKQVAIEDVRGAVQVVQVNERLSRGEGEVIRLNQGAPIQRIVVYSEPRAGGSYSVYGG